MPCCWVRSYSRREMTGCGHIVGELFLIGGCVFFLGGWVGNYVPLISLSLSPPSLSRPPPPSLPSFSLPHLPSLAPSPPPPFLPHSPSSSLSPPHSSLTSPLSLSPPPPHLSSVYVCVLPPSPLLSPSLSFVRSCSLFSPPPPPPPPHPPCSVRFSLWLFVDLLHVVTRGFPSHPQPRESQPNCFWSSATPSLVSCLWCLVLKFDAAEPVHTHTGMNEIMHSTCAFLLYHGVGVGGREVGEGSWGGGGGGGWGAIDHRLHQTHVPPTISFVVGFYTVLVVDASVPCVVCPRSVGEFGRWV